MLLSESVHHGGLVWLEMQKALIWCGLNPVALPSASSLWDSTRLLDARRIYYSQGFFIWKYIKIIFLIIKLFLYIKTIKHNKILIL